MIVGDSESCKALHEWVLGACCREELPHKKGPRSKGKGGESEDRPATAVVNYTYFDSARRDTISPVAQKRPKLTAADVMQQPDGSQPKSGVPSGNTKRG